MGHQVGLDPGIWRDRPCEAAAEVVQLVRTDRSDGERNVLGRACGEAGAHGAQPAPGMRRMLSPRVTIAGKASTESNDQNSGTKPHALRCDCTNSVPNV